MWRELKWALRDIDPTSFLFGFCYGIFTVGVIVLFIYACMNLCCDNKPTVSKPKPKKKR